jgi:muconolactone delta-isomerase
VEFLVTMTTHVPAGTSDETVAEVRQREAAHSGELAAHGSLLRLWRPPLKPGEWRTLGLFAAADADELETVLAAMPLRIWRTDEVETISPHPNDPALTDLGAGQEFLNTMTVAVPDGTPKDAVDDRFNREAQRARELSGQGHLRRLWALEATAPVRRTLGLWNAGDRAELDAIIEALPLYPWMTVTGIELSPHPSDPAKAD